MCSRETLKPRLCGRERALLLPTRCGTSGPTYRGEAYVNRQKKRGQGEDKSRAPNWGKVPNFPACAFTLMPPPVTPPHTHAAPPPQLALSMLSLFSVKRVGICQSSHCIIPFFINSHMWWMQHRLERKKEKHETHVLRRIQLYTMYSVENYQSSRVDLWRGSVKRTLEYLADVYTHSLKVCHDVTVDITFSFFFCHLDRCICTKCLRAGSNVVLINHIHIFPWFFCSLPVLGMVSHYLALSPGIATAFPCAHSGCSHK